MFTDRAKKNHTASNIKEERIPSGFHFLKYNHYVRYNILATL
jgi:hypothetical protein